MCAKAECVQKVFEFFARPEFLKLFNIKPETAEKILQSDFNCGYLAALATVFIILVLLLVIRILFYLIFRQKRCSKISIPSSDGELVVTRKAIETVVRKELGCFSQIEVRKLLLYRKNNQYSMRLYCLFSREGSGMPEITQELKPRLKEVMSKLFGIDTLNDISICIERLKEADDEEDMEGVQVAPHVDTGL